MVNRERKLFRLYKSTCTYHIYIYIITICTYTLSSILNVAINHFTIYNIKKKSVAHFYLLYTD